jgi:hypothetical protein
MVIRFIANNPIFYYKHVGCPKSDVPCRPLDLQNINILIKLLQLSTLRGVWGETGNLLINVDKYKLKAKKNGVNLPAAKVIRPIACISPHSLNSCPNNQLEF